jgi:hypothetical protein
MQHKLHRLQKTGFSLIELSVIVTLAATLAVGFLAWTSPPGITNATKNVETHRKMQDIASAIEAFRVHNGRLPCPADPYIREDNTRLQGAPTDSYVNSFGVEDLNSSLGTENAPIGIDCPNSIGSIPVNALGLRSDYMYDGWNRRFLYHVSDNLCGTSTTSSSTGTIERKDKGCSSSDYINNSGNLIIHQENGASLTEAAAFILVSYGENGFGARLPSGEVVIESDNNAEIENYNNNTTYIEDTTTSAFDDLIIYRTKSQIEQLATKKDALLLSKTKCRNNSTTIGALSTANLTTLNTNFNSYQQGVLNSGDQVTLGILLSIQEICIEYYGADEDGIALWGGPQCPATGFYSVQSRACECPTGNWDNCCPGNNWEACLDQ